MLCRSHDDQRAGSLVKRRISMALQIGNAACVLGTVSDSDAFEEIYLYIAFLNLYIIAVFWKKYRSTGMVAGMGFPTFVADHGCVSSPPNMMIHMALDWWRRSMISDRSLYFDIKRIVSGERASIGPISMSKFSISWQKVARKVWKTRTATTRSWRNWSTRQIYSKWKCYICCSEGAGPCARGVMTQIAVKLSEKTWTVRQRHNGQPHGIQLFSDMRVFHGNDRWRWEAFMIRAVQKLIGDVKINYQINWILQIQTINNWINCNLLAVKYHQSLWLTFRNSCISSFIGKRFWR